MQEPGDKAVPLQGGAREEGLLCKDAGSLLFFFSPLCSDVELTVHNHTAVMVPTAPRKISSFCSEDEDMSSKCGEIL